MPSPEEESRRTMRQFGISEDELSSKFLDHLIAAEGKNTFEELPPQFLHESMEKFPDPVERARKKFGGA